MGVLTLFTDEIVLYARSPSPHSHWTRMSRKLFTNDFDQCFDNLLFTDPIFGQLGMTEILEKKDCSLLVLFL